MIRKHIPATPKLVKIKIRPTRAASKHQNPRSVCTTQITLVMLFYATRPTATMWGNTSATHVAQLRHDRKHTCNVEARWKKDWAGQAHVKTQYPAYLLTTVLVNPSSRIVQHLHTVLIGDFGGTRNCPKWTTVSQGKGVLAVQGQYELAAPTWLVIFAKVHHNFVSC